MMSLFEMAQASLVDRGITVSGFINRSQVVNAAFTHSSSDFLIFWLVGLKICTERLAGQRRNVPEMDAYRFAFKLS